MKKPAGTKFAPIRLLEDQPIEDIKRDYLGLKPWAEMIARAALGTRGPFTIGVHGAWGYGKTTLLKLTQALVEKHDEGVVAVWFNAWQFEREEHPLFPLIAGIADEIDKKTPTKAIGKIGAALRGLAGSIKFNAEVGVPLVGKLGVEVDTKEFIEQMNPLEGEMLYHTAFAKLEEVARKESGAKIVVFVDDLDRCQPDKAVALLESIKLILAQPGFVFVLAVHRQLVESFLQKCYIERFGAPEGDWGRFYMEKIIQLPIEIPSHRSRFETYVEQVLAELDEGGWKDSEPIKALKGIQTVLATGAGTNPRSLVRLVNNFLLDCTLWPDIRREGKLEEYQDVTSHVAAALAFNRILPNVLGDLYDDLIADQDLCNAILQGRTENEPEEPPDDEEGGGQPAKLRRGPKGPDSRHAVLRALGSREGLLAALCKRGGKWLRDADFRRAVVEFAQTERPYGGTAEFPEPIAGAIRVALGLEQGEPIPASRLAEVTCLNLEFREVGNAGLQHLENLSGLQRLDLNFTDVGDAGLEHLKNLSGLQRLYVMNTQVGDAGLAHLENLSGLQRLDLDGTRVGDAGLEHLKNLSSLDRLDLRNTRVTEAGVAKLRKELPDVEVLR